MICKKCKKRKHHKCKGGTWCDCQHRVKVTAIHGLGEKLSELAGLHPTGGMDTVAMQRLLLLPDFSGTFKGVFDSGQHGG